MTARDVVGVLLATAELESHDAAIAQLWKYAYKLGVVEPPHTERDAPDQ